MVRKRWREDRVRSGQISTVLLWSRRLLTLLLLVLVWFGVKSYSQREWVDGETRMVVVLSDSGDVGVVRVDPSSGSLKRFILPGDLEIPLIRGFGRYKVSALNKIIDQSEIDDETIEDSLSHLFATPVVGVLEKDDLERFAKSDLSWDLVWSGRSKTMSWWDRVVFYRYLFFSSSTKNVFFDFESLVSLDAKTIDDGQSVLSLDDDALTEFVQAYLLEENAEQHSVVIVNSSGSVGLSAYAKKMFERLGLDVIKVETGDGVVEVSQIFIDEEVVFGEDLVGKVEYLMGVEVNPKEGTLLETRGEMQVILGSDYWKFLKVSKE